MNSKHFARAIRKITLRIGILSALLLVAHASAVEAPTQQVVEKVLKSNWDRSTSATQVRSVLTLNSVKFGKAYKATVQEVQVEGVPDKALVTPAVVDFTVRSYYNNETQAVQRVREARVYKDKMDEWTVMTGSVKGQDVTTREPAKK